MKDVNERKLKFVPSLPYGGKVVFKTTETVSPEHSNIFHPDKTRNAIDASHKVTNPKELIIAYLEHPELTDQEKSSFLDLIRFDNEEIEEEIFLWCLQNSKEDTFNSALWSIDPSVFGYDTKKYIPYIQKNENLTTQMVINVSILSRKLVGEIVNHLPTHLNNLKSLAELFIRFQEYRNSTDNQQFYLNIILQKARTLSPETADFPDTWFQKYLLSLYENNKL